MRTLAVVVAFCAALATQPADNLDRLFQAHDQLKQTGFTIDFAAMTLRLSSARTKD